MYRYADDTDKFSFKKHWFDLIFTYLCAQANNSVKQNI